MTLGHVYPVVMKFKGGKGAATIIGVCLTMQPLWTAVSFLAGVVFLLTVKVGSLTSFIMMCAPIVVEGASIVPSEHAAIVKLCFLAALFCLTLFAHRSNIAKLFSGRERLVVLFKPKRIKLL